MKHTRIFWMTFYVFFIVGCSSPIGKSLLSPPTQSTSTVEEEIDNTQIDIQPDTTAISVDIDDTDRVEITGSCKDLDRKNNLILVEAFAGEDENVVPYISNDISDKCQTVDSGLPTTDRCFWVSNGIGLKEDAGLPTERSFPQCHNGRFGFSIKLGQILENPVVGQPNLKYTIRFKLRTIDGLLSDTQWSYVTVLRDLKVPQIDSIALDLTLLRCTINTSPARFNQNIMYTLTRTFTDAVQTSAGATALYSGTNSLAMTDGVSVYSWYDAPSLLPNFILEGVTYNYTLTSVETQYSYTTVPTKNSAVATCTTNQPQLNPTPPTATAGTCYNNLISAPHVLWGGGGVSYEWGYGTAPNWPGAGYNATTGFTAATCGDVTACTQAGLTGGTTYYFAVRERSLDGQIGKWSPIVPSCKPP